MAIQIFNHLPKSGSAGAFSSFIVFKFFDNIKIICFGVIGQQFFLGGD
ncbi:MAG: hypothetical protein U9Q34_06520 [Elusimicrobiota bacterium]|nr:hypothetical protein [Elusimicrobiota bacterium]